MRVLVLLASLVSLGIGASPAVSEPFFDTLGNLGDVYDDTGTFFNIGDHTDFGGGVGSDWYQGFRFTSAATGVLVSLEVAVGHLDLAETIEFTLYADNGGSLGAPLETITIQTTAGNYDGSIESAAAASTTVLVAGTSYWLMATSVDPTIWYLNELGVSADRLWTPDGVGGSLGADTTGAAAFRLNGPPPVPGPGAPALIGVLAVTGAAITRLRFASARRR